MRYIIITIIAFLFVGCSTKVPVATKYKIDTTPKITVQKNSKCMTQSLKVMQSFSSSMLMSSEMYYVVDSNKIYPYSVAQWARTPNRIVSNELYKILGETGLFKTVQGSKSRTNTSWILESKVEDFMQYYENNNKDSFVKVSIHLSILENQSSKVIASKVFKSTIKSTTADANGGVKALNNALSDVLSQSALWFVEECNDTRE